MIRTVKGDIDEKNIGHSQCHEHLFVEKGASYKVSKSLYMDDEEKSLKELSEYGKNGGSLVVDAQPGFFGRMAESLAYVSEKSGVSVVASTGFHKLGFCDMPDFFLGKDADDVADFFVSEIEEGMLSSRKKGYRKTGIRAGIIKTAIDSSRDTMGLYPELFRAAAEAQKRTGAPVLCHTDPGCDALKVLRFFTDAGVPTCKVIICHLDRARRDIGYNAEIAQEGAFLDYDSVCRLKYLSHDEEISFILEMAKRGFSKNILLSLDTTNERLLSYGGDIGLSYILTDFKSMLAKAGVDGKTVDEMTVLNARRALKFGQ